MDLSSPVEAIILAAAGVTALEVIRRKALAPLWRFVGWVRHEVRDEIERRRKIDEIVERELTNNGGSSMKDQATQAATMATEAATMAKQAAKRAANLDDQVAEIRSAQATTFAVLDEIVERRAEDAAAVGEMRVALGELADLKSVIIALHQDDPDPLDDLRRDRRVGDIREEPA